MVENMIEFPLGYREVVPDQTLPEKWKEIILNTGKRTLTFIKVYPVNRNITCSIIQEQPEKLIYMYHI